ncbi:MAG: hypothetical protein RL562_3018, partial [Planctomycetota bacterium]
MIGALVTATMALSAQSAATESDPRAEVRSQLRRYCTRCHRGEDP